MATIKQLIGSERAESLYALKDRIKGQGLLDDDPMFMNRTKFETYLAAKAEAIVNEQTTEGVEYEQAFHNAHVYIKVLDGKWRMKAKELGEAVTS